MLSAVNRMRAASDFMLTVRKGRRSGNNLVVVYSYIADEATEADLVPKVGFIVGKKVGNSVTRHNVARKLRHQMREFIDKLAVNRVVVRALPECANATSVEIRFALEHALTKNRALNDEE